MVAPGKGTVHVHLSPRIQLAPPGSPPGDTWICTPIELGVNAQRRLRCMLRFVNITSPVTHDMPGFCDYLIVVVLAAAGGQP